LKIEHDNNIEILEKHLFDDTYIQESQDNYIDEDDYKLCIINALGTYGLFTYNNELISEPNLKYPLWISMYWFSWYSFFC
jgi:starvation-inducible outer membrane lipoprotein